ncbi:hypothetical protein H1C71_040396 [Ictidomys tridecemlineatus]|nr:hypothetical protein H1C71_040396 [Ictidomys tridecemlineatus]KAG3257299.1 hypothetical protein H1C71_040396 [Ictidomys tridecemlineatus]
MCRKRWEHAPVSWSLRLLAFHQPLQIRFGRREGNKNTQFITDDVDEVGHTPQHTHTYGIQWKRCGFDNSIFVACCPRCRQAGRIPLSSSTGLNCTTSPLPLNTGSQLRLGLSTGQAPLTSSWGPPKGARFLARNQAKKSEACWWSPSYQGEVGSRVPRGCTLLQPACW